MRPTIIDKILEEMKNFVASTGIEPRFILAGPDVRAELETEFKKLGQLFVKTHYRPKGSTALNGVPVCSVQFSGFDFAW